MKNFQATLLSIIVKLGMGTSCIRIENKLHKILPGGSMVEAQTSPIESYWHYEYIFGLLLQFKSRRVDFVALAYMP